MLIIDLILLLLKVRRWSQQYYASVPPTRGPMPDAVLLISWLEANVPPDDAAPTHPAVCHGDYRLDNLVIDPDSARGGWCAAEQYLQGVTSYKGW